MKIKAVNPTLSPSQNLYMWVVTILGLSLSIFLLFSWLNRPLSTADLIPIAWPTFSDMKQNLHLALSGYTEGYVRTIWAYLVFIMLSLSFLFAGNITLSMNKLKSIRDILSPSERMGISYLLGSLVFSILWLILGSIGVHTTILALTTAIAGTLGYFVQWWKARTASVANHFDGNDKLFWYVLAAFLLIHSTIAVEQQVYSDTYLTHLALPNLYIQNGRVFGNPYNIYSYFPQNTEMLVMWCQLLGSEMGAALIMNGFLAALLAITWGLIRRHGSPLLALATVMLLWSSPTLIWFATTIKNDFPSGVFLFVHFICLKEAFDSKDNEYFNPWIFLSGLFCGAAMGHKFTAIISGFVTFALLVLNGFRNKSYISVKIFFIAFLVSMLPWLMRSIFHTGDPIYPYLNSFLGRNMVSPWHSTDMISVSTQSSGSRGFIEYFKMLIGLSFVGKSIHPPSWGPGILMAFAALGCLFFQISKGIKIAVISSLLSWIIHLFYSVEPRYHMGFLAFLGIVPFMTTALPSNGLRKAMMGFTCVTLVVSTLYTSQWNRLRSSISNILSGYSQGNYSLGTVDSQAENLRWMAHLINTRTEKSEGVLLAGVHYSHNIHRPLYFSNDRDKQMIIDLAERSADSLDLLNSIQSLGVSHILLNRLFLDTYSAHPNFRYKLTPANADKIKFLIENQAMAKFISADSSMVLLTLKNAKDQSDVVLNSNDAMIQPAGFMSVVKDQFNKNNLNLAYSLVLLATDVHMHRFYRSFAQLYKGAIEVRLGYVDEGLDKMKQAIDIAPEQPGNYISLAKFYIIMNKNMDAVPALIQAAMDRGAVKAILAEPLLSPYLKEQAHE